jgi:hypothetical protein
LKCNSCFYLANLQGSRGSTPCPLPPHRVVQGVGEKWIFSSSSRSFGYGLEEVRIRVLTIWEMLKNYDNFKNELYWKASELVV